MIKSSIYKIFIVLLFSAAVAFFSCDSSDDSSDSKKDIDYSGTWKMTKVQYSDGDIDNYPLSYPDSTNTKTLTENAYMYINEGKENMYYSVDYGTYKKLFYCSSVEAEYKENTITFKSGTGTLEKKEDQLVLTKKDSSGNLVYIKTFVSASDGDVDVTTAKEDSDTCGANKGSSFRDDFFICSEN